MERLLSILRTLTEWSRQKNILALIAGILLTAGVEYLFEDILKREIGILIILTAVLVFFTITSVGRLADAAHLSLSRSPQVSLIAYGETEVDEAFKVSSRIIQGARNRIVILSGYSTSPKDGVPARMPPSRPTYLGMIEELIEQRLKESKASSFYYRRVLQSVSPPYYSTLRTDQVDKDLKRHCAKLFHILADPRAADSLDFQLFIREPAISCPSILNQSQGEFYTRCVAPTAGATHRDAGFHFGISLVVDNYVSLAIIGERYESENGNLVRVASMQGVVDIEDSSGRTADHYVRVIDNLAKFGTRITAVE